MAATVAAAVLALSVAGTAGAAEYGPGASDTEIKLGNTQAYSGPASAYGTISKTIAAYFNKLNEEGGINGRKINFISYDDGYSPPKTVEQTRRSEEHTSELQSLMRISYAVFCLKKKNKTTQHQANTHKQH